MIYLDKFSNGDTYVGSSYSKLGQEIPALTNARLLHSLIERVELEECDEANAPSRLKHWEEVLKPTIIWDVGSYSNQEIAAVVKLFLTTTLSLIEISNLTGVGYDTVKKVLQGRQFTDITKGLDLDKIKKARIKKYVVYSLDGAHEYEIASLFESENGLKSGFLSRLKSNKYELPLEKFSFVPIDPKVYNFVSNEGLNFKMTKLEAYSILVDCGLTKNKVHKIFTGNKVEGWEMQHISNDQSWFPK